MEYAWKAVDGMSSSLFFFCFWIVVYSFVFAFFIMSVVSMNAYVIAAFFIGLAMLYTLDSPRTREASETLSSINIITHDEPRQKLFAKYLHYTYGFRGTINANPDPERIYYRFILLSKLAQRMKPGFSSTAVWLDSVDETELLDFSHHKDAVKAFCLSALNHDFLSFSGSSSGKMPLFLFFPHERKEIPHNVVEKARLNKYTYIDLEWSAAQLYELLELRFKCFQKENATQLFKDLFHESVTKDKVLVALAEADNNPRTVLKAFLDILNTVEKRKVDNDGGSWGASIADLRNAIQTAKNF